MNYVDQLKQWDEWIKEGHSSKVRMLCRQLNQKKIPRELLVDYGNIARRVGAPDLIILWLSPVVRSEKALQVKATEKEKALYALGLLRLGAFGESAQILKEIDPEKDPQVYFYRASMGINQWNYEKAIPNLKKYIKHSDVLSYSKLVGRLNLCASLVSLKKSKLAEFEISKLMRKLDHEKNQLLKGNLLEIRSQLLYDQSLFSEARKDLEQAALILHKADERSLLYVQKWQLIIKLKEDNDKKNILAQLENLKKRALEIKEWEIVRDCDLYRALTLKDQNLILKVYWGSKFSGYKKRILKQFGEFKIEPTFIWKSEAHSSSNSEITFDLVQLAPTPILKKLFFILTREFYQPLRITEILDELYENEFYNPVTSPAKMHRLITRARQWLSDAKIPVQIKSYRNAFSLELGPSCQLKLNLRVESQSVDMVAIDMPNEFFSTKEWAQAHSISERAARQELLKLVKAGRLQMRARGAQTKYKVVS